MPPAETLCVLGLAAIVKSAGTIPVPVSAPVCGEPAALSATDSVALKLPVADGAKVTAIEQVADAASALAQLLELIAKSLAFVPPSVMPEIVSAALPLLVRVNVCAALVVPVVMLPKSAVAGVSAATGAAWAAPVQLSAIDC
jgi:hypothetical protein